MTNHEYADVTSSDLANDSVYCKYTVLDFSATSAIIDVTPPEVQVLVDRQDDIGTYRVDDSASELIILQGIYSTIRDVKVDNEQGSIIIEEGAVEVFQD